MSEAIRRIEASITGTRYAKDYNIALVSTEVKKEKSAELAFLTEYFVGVKLGHVVRIDENEPHQKEHATNAIRQAMIEFLFGEFRVLLAKANYNLYNRDFDEARKAISEIERTMFYGE